MVISSETPTKKKILNQWSSKKNILLKLYNFKIFYSKFGTNILFYFLNKFGTNIRILLFLFYFILVYIL